MINGPAFDVDEIDDEEISRTLEEQLLSQGQMASALVCLMMKNYITRDYIDNNIEKMLVAFDRANKIVFATNQEYVQGLLEPMKENQEE